MDRMIVNVGKPGEVATLRAITVGRGSALELDIAGVPEDVVNVVFHAGRPGTENYSAVAASALPGGRWAVYASGLHFPDVGVGKYHVTGRDWRGGSVWLGSGRLTVEQSVLNVDPDAIPLVPDDAYVRNPVTGLWHKLNVTVEDGVLTPEFSDQGVSR